MPKRESITLLKTPHLPETKSLHLKSVLKGMYIFEFMLVLDFKLMSVTSKQKGRVRLPWSRWLQLYDPARELELRIHACEIHVKAASRSHVTRICNSSMMGVALRDLAEILSVRWFHWIHAIRAVREADKPLSNAPTSQVDSIARRLTWPHYLEPRPDGYFLKSSGVKLQWAVRL